MTVSELDARDLLDLYRRAVTERRALAESYARLKGQVDDCMEVVESLVSRSGSIKARAIEHTELYVRSKARRDAIRP